MAKKYRRAERVSKERLTDQVEQSSEKPVANKATDSVDTEILTYIESFLNGLPEAVKLERFSLESPEEAQKALVIIGETMQRLNQQLANARALQRLVLTNTSSES